MISLMSLILSQSICRQYRDQISDQVAYVITAAEHQGAEVGRRDACRRCVDELARAYLWPWFAQSCCPCPLATPSILLSCVFFLRYFNQRPVVEIVCNSQG